MEKTATEVRQSIQPTYSEPVDGEQYTVTTLLNDKPIKFMVPISDPFAYTKVTVGWWDAIKSLLCHRCIRVVVHVRGANPRIVEDVLELNSDYLGIRDCTRRRAFNERINEALHEGAEIYGLLHDDEEDTPTKD